uniref:Unannotated protein n=1 Tax=freshwater metagenome TaxID=449393 RepID=A0A6J7PY26_9ZZZZ
MTIERMYSGRLSPSRPTMYLEWITSIQEVFTANCSFSACP